MAENINTTSLQCLATSFEEEPGRPVMISVDHVSMVFNMASEQLNNLKEYAIALARHELRFKELKALDDVSLEVRRGDVFGILGTNGSGKSTLLKIVAGVLEPTLGTCTINGNIAPLIELGAGFDLELTARENIYLNGALLGYPKKFIEQHFDDIVAFAEVEQFLDMPMKNYSSGMVARIAFAIATIIVPEILIVDEVLSVGDFMFQQKCGRRIQELIKEHEVTVLIVSHNNDQIERLCNKAIWIEKGHPRLMGSAQDVCRIYRVLGGHTGKASSEQRVFDMLGRDVSPREELTRTISADDRYGSAVKLAELCHEGPSDTVIICPGEDASACLVGAGLGSTLDAPLLLTRSESLPDVTAHALRQYGASHVIALDRGCRLSPVVTSALEDEAGERKVTLLQKATIDELALAAFRAADQWGDTAVITWDGCTGDIISLLPFSQGERAPLFFNHDDGIIAPETLAALTSGAFRRLIVLGGTVSFPESCLEPLREAGLEVIRFCGKDAYDANGLIDDWIVTQGKRPRNLIITSIWNPFDALTAGPCAAASDSLIVLEDPGDLDSVARAIDYVEKMGPGIEHLVFLGDHTRFQELDKEILAKAASC